MDNQPEKSTKQGNPAIWVVLVIVLVLILGGAYIMFVQENEGNTNNANTVVTTNQNVNTANANTTANENTNVNAITSVIDTSDWVTYENEEYGFSFRYPAKLGSVGEYVPPYPNTIFNGNTIQVAGITAGEGDSFIQVYVVNDTLENVKQDIESREFEYYDKVAEWESIQLNSIPVEYARKSINFENDYFRNIYLFQNNNLVSIVYTFTNAGESDTAISTFEIK